MKLGNGFEKGLHSLSAGIYNFALIQLERDREKKATGNISNSEKVKQLENLAFVKEASGQSAKEELELIRTLNRNDFPINILYLVISILVIFSLGLISYQTSSCLSSTNFSSRYCLFVREKVDFFADKSIAEK